MCDMIGCIVLMSDGDGDAGMDQRMVRSSVQHRIVSYRIFIGKGGIIGV